MTLLERLKRLFFVPEEPAPEPADTPGPEAGPGPGPGPEAGASPDEAWLEDLVRKVAAGKDAAAVAGADFWTHVDALVQCGHGRLAAEWLDKFAVATPDGAARDAVRARAAELYAERGEAAEALGHLEALAARPAHAARAHFLLGEHHQRAGDGRRALRHFEAVLAIDVDFPNARGRARALAARRGAALADAPATDETVAGPGGGATAGARYHLVKELGRGATGAVYRARDRELEREVAVKLLHPHLYAESQAAARGRFFAEARVAASLRHPNIVAVLDLDEYQKRIVMELCAGGTLKGRLQAGPLSPEVALARHAEILSALGAAHRRGVVHRDLKPANLLYRRDPALPASEIVLADFGIAHLVPAAAAADRRAAPRAPEDARAALGTLAYMAPEQRRGEEVDPRADVYAAGVILWETLVGRLPWDQRTALGGARAAGDLTLPPAVAALVGPELAAPLGAHLLALGHPDPAARPASEAALASARALIDLARTGDESARFRAERAELFPAG